MKPDEWEFFRRCVGLAHAQFPRDVRMPGMHRKRKWYLLDKWARKGWYEYGVTLDLGWITVDGQAWYLYCLGHESFQVPA